MQSTVYVMVGCLSVCLSHRSTAATAAGGFAAEHPAGSRYRNLVAVKPVLVISPKTAARV